MAYISPVITELLCQRKRSHAASAILANVTGSGVSKLTSGDELACNVNLLAFSRCVGVARFKSSDRPSIINT